eukprot:jgi/Mesvir1/3195/Mv16348-RA.1
MREGDSDFEYGEEYSDAEASSPGAGSDIAGAKPKKVQNQPHDEEVNLSDGESIASGTGRAGEISGDMSNYGQEQGRGQGDSPPAPPHISDGENTEGEDYEIPGANDGADNFGASGGSKVSRSEMSEAENSAESVVGTGGTGYNPADFEKLQVSDEIRELFQYVGRYKPHTIELNTSLKPFIPDYIPAVGDIDEFLKVPRPDGKPDFLGLKVLDEPAAQQSDSTVLNLQLRAVSKTSGLMPVMVTSIENADKNPKKIANWIQSINDLHKSKPRQEVNYSKTMPDIEKLMQEWPPEMEELLASGGAQLPTGDLDVSLREFAKIACALLDIPVYNKPVESLHVLFMLYLEFKNNPAFQQRQSDWGAGSSSAPNVMTF